MHNLYPIEEGQLVYLAIFAFLCMLWIFVDCLARFLNKIAALRNGETCDVTMFLGFVWNIMVVWSSGDIMLWIASLVTSVLSKHIV